jgi:hypothetical protein
MNEEDLTAPQTLLSAGALPHGLDGFSEMKLGQQVSESQQSDFAQASSSQATISGGQQLKAGGMTFTLPDFGRESTSEAGVAHDSLLSPTEPQKGGEELKVPGAF